MNTDVVLESRYFFVFIILIRIKYDWELGSICKCNAVRDTWLACNYTGEPTRLIFTEPKVQGIPANFRFGFPKTDKIHSDSGQTEGPPCFMFVF